MLAPFNTTGECTVQLVFLQQPAADSSYFSIVNRITKR